MDYPRRDYRRDEGHKMDLPPSNPSSWRRVWLVLLAGITAAAFLSFSLRYDDTPRWFLATSPGGATVEVGDRTSPVNESTADSLLTSDAEITDLMRDERNTTQIATTHVTATPGSTPAPSSASGVTHPGEASGTLCSLAERSALRSAKCQAMMASSNPGPPIVTIEWALIDTVHKVIWLLVPKAGSKSWFAFFGQTVGIEPGRNFQDQLREHGLNFTNRISSRTVNREFKDFLKFSMVRHPLQKFVSGYYEVLHVRKRYQDLCPRIRRKYSNRPASSCREQPIIDFGEFAAAFSNGILPQNEHWQSQQLQIKPCNVHLDVILKSETYARDSRELSETLGIRNTSISHIHSGIATVNRTASASDDVTGLNNYDERLRELQAERPEVFRWVLDYFADDMDMFGYTWDAKQGTSGCLSGLSGCC